MKNISILLAFTLMLSACGGGESEPQSQIPNNQTPTDPVIETETNNTPEELTEEGTPANSDGNSTVSGLIPSTNAQERLNQISQGKSDPFNGITPPAVIKVDSPNSISSANNRSSIGNVASIRNNPAITNPSTNSQNQIAALDRNNSSTNNQGTLGGQMSTNSDSQNQNTGNVPQTPQLPKPLEAEKVNVTGILDIQGQTVALVQTPWDGTTRSVRVGDVISDNSGSINIRVRNISFGFPTNAAFPDINQVTFRDISSSEGMVMLEQDGRTVTREVAQQDSEAQL